MADLTAMSDSKLRNVFQQKAVLPETQLAAAEKFVSTLSKFQAGGAAPSDKVIQSGQKLLTSIEQQTEVFAFHAAILAGQEAATETDLDTKIQAVEAGVERAQQTATKLRSALKVYG